MDESCQALVPYQPLFLPLPVTSGRCLWPSDAPVMREQQSAPSDRICSDFGLFQAMAALCIVILDSILANAALFQAVGSLLCAKRGQ